MKKKVIQLIHGFSMGGAETLVKEYCLKLNKEKYDVSVLCFYKYGAPYEKILEDAGIRITYIDDYKKRCARTGVKKLLNGFEIVRRYFYIKKHLTKESPDILHSHLAVNSYVDFANLKKGTKIVHTVHNEPKRLWRNTFSRRLDFWSAKRLITKYQMRFVVLHEAMRKEVNEMFGIEDSIVLNNGIDFARFENAESKNAVRHREGIPEDAFVIGHVGRFGPQKNHKFLVEIFEKIYEQNQNAYLLMIGNGNLKGEIEEQLKSKGLESRYKILSNRSDVPDLLNAMDKFVFPSLYEGLPVTLIETQKAGLECFVSDRITESVIVSNLVIRISLEESAKAWAEHILKDTVGTIEYEGIEAWDMKHVVLRLEEIYRS